MDPLYIGPRRKRGLVKMEGGQLRVWKEAYGAPSLDHVSLEAMTYAKMNRLTRIKIVYGRLPLWAAVPRYKNSNGVYKKPYDIIRAMHDELGGIDIDNKFYLPQICRIAAYNTYITNTFGYIFASAFFYNSENYTNITKPYYYALIPFPFNFFYLRSLTNDYYMKANVGRGRQILDDYMADRLAEAEKCLAYMSEMLGEKMYIFGEQPSSVDALIYSYLAPIYYAPLKKCDFQTKLKSYYNLTKYIMRITATYFPDVKYEPVKQEDENERAPAWQIALAGLSAFTFMCWFAYSKGLIRVVF